MHTATLTEIRLHGVLGIKFGRVHRFAVHSPAQALRALCSQIRGFRDHLQRYSEPGYKVFAGAEGLAVDDLQLRTGRKVIRIVPVIAGGGAVFKIIAGIVLIIVGAILSYFGFGAGTPLMSMGASLLFSGVSELLFSAPKPKVSQNEAANNRPSYSFNGAVNTSGQGNCVPICYGELRVGSQVISAGIQTEPLP
jgi:predicted phage tail protein